MQTFTGCDSLLLIAVSLCCLKAPRDYQLYTCYTGYTLIDGVPPSVVVEEETAPVEGLCLGQGHTALVSWPDPRHPKFPPPAHSLCAALCSPCWETGLLGLCLNGDQWPRLLLSSVSQRMLGKCTNPFWGFPTNTYIHVHTHTCMHCPRQETPGRGRRS